MDSSNDLEGDNIQTSNNDTEVLKIPLSEMSFTTIEEAREYYEHYGRHNGFCIRIRSSTKGRKRSDKVTSIQFVCKREGKHDPESKNVDINADNDKNEEAKEKRKRNCSTIKCECKAQLRIKYDELDSKWKVTVFNDTHNHALVSPSKRIKLRSNQYLHKAAKNLALTFQKENIKVCKVTSVFGGEHMGFDNRKLYNFLKDVRHRNLDGGDAQSVLNYFKKKQAQNPQFFYAIKCDEDGRATNFFWVDSRSRMAYQYFGDVVSFDTTYRSNKYDMPFAPFTGVNHHWQSIQFGCALLQDETEVTFTWLFQTWLEAMGGCPPIALITDQDLGMKGAIAKIFPNTRHRLCIWHILKKFVEKLSHVYFKKSKFKKEMKKCLWSTYKREDFEERWMSLIKEYGLEGNEWIQQLYDIRELWVPVYNLDTFFAGMNTTGRSEGINSFFNDFVTWTTNLKEFVVKYEQALKRIIQRESDEDFVSEHKSRIVKVNEFLLKHAAKVYTRNLFNKFKDEIDEVSNFKVEENRNTDGRHSYVVMSKIHKYQKFIVTLDPQTYEGKCECKYFEFVGILCRHILKVFVRLDIDVIPDHFILPRWRQKANKFRLTTSTGLVLNDGKEESDALRLGHMCQESTKIACLAYTSDEAYRFYIENMKYLSDNVIRICDSVPPSINETDDVHSTVPSQILLLDPNISQTKGRKKDGKGKGKEQKDDGAHHERIKSGIELSIKKKRKCKACKKFGHDWRTCPQNPTSKTHKALEAESESEYSSSDQDKLNENME